MEAGTVSVGHPGRGRRRLGRYLPFSPRNLDRYPRLDTVIMVEKAVCDSRGNWTITEIWRRLPKKVMWTSFTTILDYLEYSGKIRLEEDRTVTWLWNPQGVKKALSNPKLVVR